MILTLQVATEPTTFDWWVGVWIPIIAGAASILLAVLALVFAVAANNQAKAANTTAQTALKLSKDIADMEQRERERDRVAVLRERRHRIALQTNQAFQASVTANTPPTTYNDALYAMARITDALRNASISEGLPLEDHADIADWLVRAGDEVIVQIVAESQPDRASGPHPWTQTGWLEMGAALAFQLHFWQQTGEIRRDLNIARFMDPDTRAEEFVRMNIFLRGDRERQSNDDGQA
ncbi:hypothetical protein [Agromyces allii]|uniref:hypothetical protein n=1 Tax=Agromyces allii TaxID=393607 RepID=UPI0012F942B0|nr:hypothetical protein [Agromyces allii]